MATDRSERTKDEAFLVSLLSRVLTRPRRLWIYDLGQVLSVLVFAFAASALFSRGLELWKTNVAIITAICFLFLSAELFMLCGCLKEIDQVAS
jgi:hypothetical protein